ncbi:helix-turn-helix transcriptional regulator [Solirubrobacter sp. CPCC 204708]|uniref:AraC family transcriptional regulator n=1 Tax=Solirubrobacter deserti TaxID=2282478 RepID=A0ABT4RGI1_9ACTN|nr:AraC family transcriptional regulator [Solirubrobacter deserti]MBE2319613.1 helix-turn-helix transcriptional regulator [Solirubrobacter deserti]MDA0137648.1 AraC family transcriptional regulator [Solirubrobacter deserti]
MGLTFETRLSDSPWIASVWTCRSEQVAEMTSVATETWGLVFWEQDGTAHATVTGPERRSGTAPVPEDASFVGIQFAVGTSLRAVATPALVDSGILLPGVTRRAFWLDGRRWETPHPDDAEALVARMVRRGAVVRDPVVTDVLRGARPAYSDRTLERRFRAATGLSRGAVRQIERVRAAAQRLIAGEGVDDVVAELGYYDQPHLARALRRYVGRTALELRDGVGGALALDPEHVWRELPLSA